MSAQYTETAAPGAAAATAATAAAARIGPATAPRDNPLDDRLLVLDPRAPATRHARVADLPTLLRAGDLLVVNDAATLPASLHSADGQLELRLIAEQAGGAWTAALFGAGDWRTRTEDRPAPAALAAGAVIRFGSADGSLCAVVESVSSASPRLIDIRFDREGAALWAAIYRHGRPVQYSYLSRTLELWDTQTSYAGRPWAVELPSAGRPLRSGLLLALARRGIGLATVTHAAGLSSTGDDALDALLPLPERYEIPAATIAALATARAAGGRVLAVGTTVVRALEGSALQHGGAPRAGTGITDLRIGAGFRPQVVCGLLTGVHDTSSSHFELLQAFAPLPVLRAAWAEAEELGYLGHEFGDSALILGECPALLAS